MTVLRKACQSCTASKRKCVVQLPKCARCAQKGLDCTYDLEPLNAPIGAGPSKFESPGYCIMKTLEHRISGIDPGICGTGHQDAVDMVRVGYLAVPELVKAGKPAVFVHPKLHLQGNYNHFAAFGESEKGVSYERFKHLTQLDLNTIPVTEALTALQALLVYLATFLFSSDKTTQMYAEESLKISSEWAQVLLTSAQTLKPRNQSPWQDWLFGESVRRTIAMSYGLSLALCSFKYGYCSNWLFVESLPFDSRVGLWMAQSPQAWIAAARARTGEDVGERLNSFHEFAEKLDESNVDFCGDTFLALVAISHNGSWKSHESGPGGS